MKTTNVRNIIVALVFLALAIMPIAPSASAKPTDTYTIDWYTIDSGGAQNLQGGNYSLSGTIGQFDAGSQIGTGYTLNGGFWVEVFGYRLYLPLIMR